MRSAIITNIVASIRDASEAGFVRLDLASGHWYEVGDKMARDKVRKLKGLVSFRFFLPESNLATKNRI